MVFETKFYELLNITPDSSFQEIKKAYRQSALKYHPDKNLASNDNQLFDGENPVNLNNNTGGNQSIVNATKQFQQIYTAYTILSDPVKRKIYDLEGEKGLENLNLFTSSPSSVPNVSNKNDNLNYAESLNSPGHFNNRNNNNNNGMGMNYPQQQQYRNQANADEISNIINFYNQHHHQQPQQQQNEQDMFTYNFQYSTNNNGGEESTMKSKKNANAGNDGNTSNNNQTNNTSGSNNNAGNNNNNNSNMGNNYDMNFSQNTPNDSFDNNNNSNNNNNNVMNNNRKQLARGKDIHHNVYCNLQEIYHGKTVKLSMKRFLICFSCKGNGGVTPLYEKCNACSGFGIINYHQHQNSFVQQRSSQTCQSCNGSGTIFIRYKDVCKYCKGSRRLQDQVLININIPKGCEFGYKIIYKEKADEEIGFTTGDVIITILESKESKWNFIRLDENYLIPSYSNTEDGNNNKIYSDLLTVVKIPLKLAILGGLIKLRHLNKKTLFVFINRGDFLNSTNKNLVKYLPNYGLPIFNQNENAYGDLFIKFQIDFPSPLELTDLNYDILGKVLDNRNMKRRDMRMTPVDGSVSSSYRSSVVTDSSSSASGSAVEGPSSATSNNISSSDSASDSGDKLSDAKTGDEMSVEEVITTTGSEEDDEKEEEEDDDADDYEEEEYLYLSDYDAHKFHYDLGKFEVRLIDGVDIVEFLGDMSNAEEYLAMIKKDRQRKRLERKKNSNSGAKKRKRALSVETN